MNPNRHVICFTVTYLDTGETYDEQESREHRGGIDGALAELALAAEHYSGVTKSQDGFNRPVSYGNFRLHSWHQAPVDFRSFSPAPMSGPENDEAWISGPGSPAQ
jgi:hypothetical protein